MVSVKNISQNELERLQFIKKEAIDIATYLGELNYQKTLIDIQIEQQKNRIQELRLSELQLFDELKTNYGNVNINLETGEYTVFE